MRSLILIFMFFSGFAFAQDKTMELWPGGVPNSKPTPEKEIQDKGDILWIRQVQKPEIAIFLPPKSSATGQAVLIFPGGGYEGLAYDWEGTLFANWLNSKGIAGIVVKYRLPNSKSIKVSNEAPLQDAKRAIRMVRFHAGEWNIDKNKIGIMGFSAGGHLASTLGTHFNTQDKVEKDEINSLSARPDFMALIYPVITMDKSLTHMGSRNSLLGDSPSAELVETYSNELRVQVDTPPTFLVHASDDGVVPVANSIKFYEALIDKNISAEMHIYPEGAHGFSFGNGKGYLDSWTDRLADWLKAMNENQ